MSCYVPFLWEGPDEHFVKAHDEFQEKTGEHGHVLEILRTYLPPAIENISESVHSHNSINILSIGSGDGYMDVEILKIIYSELKRKFPTLNPIKMFNRAIEPLQSHVRLYKTNATNLPKELSPAKITFDITEPKTFDDYAVEIKEHVPFHIVHFIHSAYYCDDIEHALTHCYDHELAAKGVIILVLAKAKTFDIVTRLAKDLPTDNISGRSFGDEVARIARKNGWRYEVHTTEFPIDVTEVFDENSRGGNLLLDFFTYTMNFRAKSKPETVDAALEIIRNTSTCSNGNVFAKFFNHIHFIFKD